MPNHQFQIRQCLNPTCCFRFPAAVEDKKARRCPKCGTPTEVATEIDPPHQGSSVPEDFASLPVAALLDNVRSTFNVGAIFRTADAAGLQRLYLCGITATPQNPKVAKTALGSELLVPWTYELNSLAAARKLKQAGTALWALESFPHSISIFQAAQKVPDRPLLLIVGNELAGVDPELLAICDQIVYIPMRGIKESLNVAVAFSIAVFMIQYGWLSSHLF